MAHVYYLKTVNPGYLKNSAKKKESRRLTSNYSDTGFTPQINTELEYRNNITINHVIPTNSFKLQH